MTVAQKSPVTLIIAEKPSVAADLVKALGANKFKKEKTHINEENARAFLRKSAFNILQCFNFSLINPYF